MSFEPHWPTRSRPSFYSNGAVVFWPYRMASNPFAAPRSEAQLAAAQNAAARLRKPSSLQAEIPEGPPDGW
jgi:hypothetical protein